MYRKLFPGNMRVLRGVSAAGCLLLIAMVAVDNAKAQSHRRGQAREMQPVPMEQPLTGRLHSIIPAKGLIQMVSSENQPWFVEVNPRTKIKVSGTGGPEMLRPGAAVRFFADLTPRGDAVNPIRKIRVVNVDANFRPGILEEPGEGDVPDGEEDEETTSEDERSDDEKSDEASEVVEGDASTGTDAPNEDDSMADTENEEDEPGIRKNRQQRPSKLRTMQANRYWVSGQLRSIQKGKIQVLAGTTRVRAEVNDSTQVDIDVEDLRLARPGDNLVVTGGYYGPGKAVASSVEVTLIPPAKPKAKKQPLSRNSLPDKTPRQPAEE